MVVAETYPAEVYRHLDLGIRRHDRSKRRQRDRAKDTEAIDAWAGKSGARLTDRLRVEIADGFGEDGSGEDRFDAVVGLFGMLNVVFGHSLAGEPDDDTRRIEGWILGQPFASSAEA